MKLYKDQGSHLADDFMYRQHQQQLPPEAAEAASHNDLFCELDDRLQPHNKTTKGFGLPTANRSQCNHLDLAADELDPDAEYTFNGCINQLNADQTHILNNKKKIDNKEGSLIFIDAPGETGKKFLLNTIPAYVRNSKGIVLATASSNMATTLLKLGRTAHSQYKLPILPQATSNV